MRNLIFGGIGLLWGGSMLLGTLIQIVDGRFPSNGNGAYAAGQMSGMGFALLLFGAGLYYFVKGWRERGDARR